LTSRGPQRIDYWSVSLGQDAIGNAGGVKETLWELKQRFALTVIVLNEQVRLPRKADPLNPMSLRQQGVS
jgi:hypothetical protein